MTRSIRTIGAAAVLAAGLTLTACSGAAPASTDTTSKAALGAQGQKAAAAVTAAIAAHDTFEAPGPAIPGVDKLKGKVVYYVAAAIEVPLFKQLSDSMAVALKTAGVQLRVCDAKGNPGNAADCLGQAVDAHAAAVVAGGFPDVYAPVAFKAVRDAGIPLLYTLTSPMPSSDPKKVAYIAPNLPGLEALNADWVIADSNAKAHVLVVEAVDNPDLIAWVQQGALATYKSACSGCKVKVVTTNVADIDKLPSLVTAALVADPSIDYVQVSFDDRLQPTLQGIQASGNTVKVVSEDGTLSAMQGLAKGDQLAAEVGYDNQSYSWYSADRVLRMMAGQAAGDYTFPVSRIFDRKTAAALTLTPAGEASSAWYGTADYKAGLQKLWGVK